jgi:hypothetical protein
VFTDTPRDRLQLTAQYDSVSVSIGLTRDDVRHLVAALDDWLYVSRPS